MRGCKLLWLSQSQWGKTMKIYETWKVRSTASIVVALISLGLIASTHFAAANSFEISVTCTSQGEVCDNYGTIEVGAPGTSTFVYLNAPTKHCSNVIYILKYQRFRSSAMPPLLMTLAKTKVLAPGQGDSFKITVPATPLRVYAEGVPGGCNTGRLASWGLSYGTSAVLAPGEPK
jgi:hypothetical protein